MTKNKNKDIYERLWGEIEVRDYRHYPTWNVIKRFINKKSRLLELGPGVRPKIPPKNSYFIDISENAIIKLNKLGAHAKKGHLERIPFSSSKFDLVCAFDVIEHIENDQKVLNEISRVLKNKGHFIFSVPLHEKFWDEFDSASGHVRRYEPKELISKLNSSNLQIIAFSKYSMRTKNKLLNKIGAFFLNKTPILAIRVQDFFFRFFKYLEKKKIKLIKSKFLDKLNDMYTVLIIAKKKNGETYVK